MKKMKLLFVILGVWLFPEESKLIVKEKVAKTNIPLPATKAFRRFAAENQGYGIFTNVRFTFYKIPQFGLRTRSGDLIILMPIVNPNEVITACINAERTKKSRVDIANYILLKAPLTTWITIPLALISPLAGMIAAENDAPNDTDMNAAWFILNPQLKKIMAVVQEGMDNDRIHSETICNFHGFHVRGKEGKDIQHFEGFTGTVTGTANFLAPVGQKYCGYAWRLWNAAETESDIIKVSTWAHCTLFNQPSKTPIKVSVDIIDRKS